MKKLLTIMLCAAGSCVMAQTVQQIQPAAPKFSHQVPGVLRLNIYTSYAFDDKVDNSYSSTQYVTGTIKGGFEYGGGLEYVLRPAYGLEFTYLRLDSKATLDYYNSGQQPRNDFDLASNYLMLGGNRYLLVNPRLEPYFGIQMGMGIYNVDNQTTDESGSATKFAWGIKAGANIWLSDKIGLKLQAGLLSAVQSVGGGLYFGTGGTGAGVTGYSTYYQWTLGGGLIFDINGNKK